MPNECCQPLDRIRDQGDDHRMTSPQYLMWFSRHGLPHLETQYWIEDCYDLKRMLHNADTSTFDQYGVLNYVEHIERGVIPKDEWEAGLEEYIKMAEAEEAQEREANPPAAYGEISVRPPAGHHHATMWSSYRTFTGRDQMRATAAWLADELGKGRVNAVWVESA